MHIEIVDKTKLIITAESKEEAVSLIDVCTKLEPVDDEYLERLTLQKTAYENGLSKDASTGNGGWARVNVGTMFLDPYWDVLYRRTGCSYFDVDLMPAFNPITHTHFKESFRYDAGMGILFANIVCIGWPLMGERLPDTATLSQDDYLKRAAKAATRYMEQDLGETKIEPEFIPVGDRGNYQRNPKYATGKEERVARAKNEKVWVIIWRTWVERFATQEQKDLLVRKCTYNNKVEPVPTLMDYSGFLVDSFSRMVTWDEFRALGVKHEQQANRG